MGLLNLLADGLVRRILFQPDQIAPEPASYGGSKFEVVGVTTPDGLKLSGLACEASGMPVATLLFLHGNGGCAATRADYVAPLAQEGFRIIVADYRGYGGNQGQPTLQGLVTDADAWLSLAIKSAVGTPLIVMGHSLGGTIASLIVGERQDAVKGLLTLGAPWSFDDMVPVVLNQLSSDRFDMDETMRGMTLRWIIAHEVDDDVVPFTQMRVAQELVAGLKNVSLETFRGGRHPVEWRKLVAPLLALAFSG